MSDSGTLKSTKASLKEDFRKEDSFDEDCADHHNEVSLDMGSEGPRSLVENSDSESSPSLDENSDSESSLDEDLDTSHSLEKALIHIPAWIDKHETLRKDLLALITNNEDLQAHFSRSLEEFKIHPSHSVAFLGACTSVITEISYNDEDDYRADVHFVTRTEWTSELNNIKGDIGDDIQEQTEKFKKMKYQRDITRVSERVKKSWQKLVAVYSTPEKPFTFSGYRKLVHETDSIDLLLDNTRWPFLADCIDVKRQIVCTQAKDLSSKLRSSIGDRGPWPLIKKVNIRVHSAVLSTGITLVDLPGFGDSNEARSAAAEEYRKSVDHYFVVIPVTRAVDSIFTQVTKCDDVQVDDIATNYELEFDENFTRLKEENEQWRERLDIARADEERAYRAVKGMMKNHLKASGLTGYLEHEDSLSVESFTETSNEAVSVRKHTIDNNTNDSRPAKRSKYRHDGDCLPVSANHDSGEKALSEELTDKRDQTKLCESELRKSDFALKTFCSKFRSQVTKQSLIQSFENELEEYEHSEFPVFTVTAQDYQVLKKRTNGDARTFLDVADTQIPSLQEHCRTLPRRFLKIFAERAMGTLARSVRSILQVMQTMEKDEADRKRLESEWGRHAAIERPLKARLLEKKYREAAAAMVERFKVHFDSGMSGSCADAACHASSEMLEIAEKIIKTNNWQRFRAGMSKYLTPDSPITIQFFPALRRKGVYEDLNINHQFTTPFILAMVYAWKVTLDQDMFPETSGALERVTQDLLEQIPDACHSSSFKKTVTNRVALMFEETTSTLEALHRKVTCQIGKSRRKIATSIAPHIQDQLVEGYKEALEYEGTGSVALQKEYFIGFVKEKREIIFTDLHDFILENLNSLADSTGRVVGKEMELLADKVCAASLRRCQKYNNFAILKIYNEMSLIWQDNFDVESAEAVKLRKTTEKFHKLLETWIDALKDTKMECVD
ncbi:hypothetical protein C0992_005517 [Termitomyces sp. T32_za158]|nr:hypothetical protein C0992_005517 [Termitomyces sp. T32_za158]